MDWSRIREHYKRELAAAKHRGLDQTKIARAGGCKQPDISRLIKNKNKGPAAEILIQAIEGLGLPVSEFFKRVEAGEAAGAATVPRSVGGKALVVQTLIETFQITIDALRSHK